MIKLNLTLFLIACSMAITGLTFAEDKLENGKDRVDTPAIGAGLCVHHLSQSNMVLQRDKPIRIWGWAKVTEKISVTFDEKSQAATVAPAIAELRD